MPIVTGIIQAIIKSRTFFLSPRHFRGRLQRQIVVFKRPTSLKAVLSRYRALDCWCVDLGVDGVVAGIENTLLKAPSVSNSDNRSYFLLYARFNLSLREVEELMLERGVVVTYEAIRRWCEMFGQACR